MSLWERGNRTVKRFSRFSRLSGLGSPRASGLLGLLLTAVCLLGLHNGSCAPNFPSKYGLGTSGMMNKDTGEPRSDMIRLATRGGFKWARIWIDLGQIARNQEKFNSGDPQKDWNWNPKRDAQVDALHQNGFSIVANLKGNPKWNRLCEPEQAGGSTQDGCKPRIPCDVGKPIFEWAYPPKDPSVLETIAREVARRYGNRVAAFEIWNEPDKCIRWQGTPGEFRRWALAPIFDGIKSANPKPGIIVGPALGSAGNYRKWITQKNASTQKVKLVRPLDYFTFHTYGDPAAALWVLEQQAIELQSCIDSKTCCDGKGHCLKGLWLTEFGFGKGAQCSNPDPAPGQAAVKVYKLCDSLPGCGKAFYFTLATKGDTCVSLVNFDGTPRPKYDTIKEYLRKGPHAVTDLGPCHRAADGTPCSDGDACDGLETCQGQVCVNGPPLACDDGNACNGTETCQGGICSAGTPITCDDANPCTFDYCATESGCTAVPYGAAPECINSWLPAMLAILDE